MGRLPKNGFHKSLHSSANVLKSKHRHADSKYRANVQYLYSKLKEMSPNKVGKDSLLSVTLSHIQSLEKEFIEKIGSEEMKNYQNDFKNFLLHEEALWKMKDTAKWWEKVEEALGSHDLVTKEKTGKILERVKVLNMPQKNLTSNKEFPKESSCSSTRMVASIPTSQTFDGFSVRSTKSKTDLVEDEPNIFENDNMTTHVPKFNQNIFAPCDESGSFLSFEEQNYFPNENLADPILFENYFF